MNALRQRIAAAICLVAAGGAASATILQGRNVDKADLIRAMRLRPGAWTTEFTIVGSNVAPNAPGGTVPPGARADESPAAARTDCVGTGPAPDGSLTLPGFQLAPECNVRGLDLQSENWMSISVDCGQTEGGPRTELALRFQHTPTEVRSFIFLRTRTPGGYASELSMVAIARHRGQCAAR